ncbi:MAG: hypothetical protein ACOH1O_03465 [Flavobacterium sp.]
MSKQIEIIISNVLSATTLLKILSEIDSENDLDLTLELKCQGFIKAEIYLLLVSFINNLRAANHTVNISFKNLDNCSAANYASRIDFFKHLDIEFEEKANRNDVSGNLIPITKIGQGVMDLDRDILSVFQNDFNMSEKDVGQLSLIISEMFCNTSIHSKSKSGAYLYCQKYKGAMNCLEFILVDSGIGIKSSLQKNPEYENISNKDAVSNAIKYEVTCGEGRGHGLYFASEFVRRNNGEMLLISGDERIVIKNGTVNSITNNPWNGVYLKFLFKFDSAISLNELMLEKSYEIH